MATGPAAVQWWYRSETDRLGADWLGMPPPLDHKAALTGLTANRRRQVARMDRTVTLEHLATCPATAGTPWHRGEESGEHLATAEDPADTGAIAPSPAPVLQVRAGYEASVLRVDDRRRLSLRETQSWWVHGDHVHLGVHEVQGTFEVHVTDEPPDVAARRAVAIESRVRLHLHPGLVGTLALGTSDQVLAIVEPADANHPRRIRLRPFTAMFTTKEMP